jgi:CO/xanthine dehydrogenase Mo-binding subunit
VTAETKIVGRSVVRRGAFERLTGRASFGADQVRPGDLALAVVRAPVGPARIKAIDAGPALALPGVIRVFTAADVPGENLYGIIAVTRDQPVLAQGLVRCPGEAVALVAAETPEQARAGARAVRVDLEALPGVFDPGQALEPGAPLVHDQGNLVRETSIVRGDVAAALAKAAAVVSGRYTTAMLDHAALEPEGGRADWVDGRVVVTACTQNPHYDRADLCRILGKDHDQVRVIQAETGGGFGGKLDLSVQPFLALAAWHLRRPVSMVYSREESFWATAKRHPVVMDLTTAADEQGQLVAATADILADTGAYASYALAVCVRAAVHALGPYRVPNLKIRSRAVYTNNAWAGAMRGFGVPQAAVAHEGQMDALARALDIDPLELRIRNALRSGDVTATGQRLGEGVGLVQCLEAVRPYYDQWRHESAGSDTLGAGVAAMYYGIGNTAVSNPAGARVEITADGDLIVYTGAADIGQGSDTILTQIAAERLGWDLSRVKLVRGDTDLTPNAGATSASRQTFISGNAVHEAAIRLEGLVIDEAAKKLEISPRDLEMIDGRIVPRGVPDKAVAVVDLVAEMAARGERALADGAFDPLATALDPETGQGEPYQTYAFAAHAVLAQVEHHSGLVKVRQVAAAHDVGRAVNPRAAEGQIAGGVVMGLGYALMEEYRPGPDVNLDRYHIPTVADAPAITPILIEPGEPDGPYGAKGLGEPALIPTAPAVAAAVSSIVGRPMRHLPLNLERVMAAITAREKGEDDPD